MQAPFNFVPVSKNVFFPGWAHQISHDMPFSDGEDGVISLKITALNPIYVRNGHTSEDREHSNERFLRFSNINNKPFIPATSLKGSLRNVLEILSFSKLTLDKNMKYATRDWTNDVLYDLKKNQNQIRCGWLSLLEGKPTITDCGKPKRINHKRLDEYFSQIKLNFSFENYFSTASGIDLNKSRSLNNKDYDPKTALFKYALLEFDHSKLESIIYDEDNEYINERQPDRVMISSSGEKGTIVFTGSPDKWAYPRKPKGGKFYEFIFPEINSSERYVLTDIDFSQFNFFNGDSPDWNYWKKKLYNNEKVPIFFRIKGNEVKDFGLAYLYKMPFLKSPYDLLSPKHKTNSDSHQPDLAECIFGYTDKTHSLKGRVQFSHAFAETFNHSQEERVVLGSPKASYYPLYVYQPNGRNGVVSEYETYSDRNASIAGWKRYPIRAQIWNENTGNDSIDSKFIPLTAGSVFKSKVKFHNLRKVEIGALLSSITFHGNQGYFHMIGMGKPYGYGKIKIEIDFGSSTLKYGIKEYLINFEEVLVESEHLFNGTLGWHSSEEIKQLFTLSFDFNLAGNQLLYMKLNNANNENEFLEAKAQNEYLEAYTRLMSNVRYPESLYENVSIERKQQCAEDAKQKEEARIKRETEALAKQKAKMKAEAERIKEINRQKALAGVDLSEIDPANKKAWDNLKKMVERFICNYRKDNNYKRVISNFPDGALPESEHEKIFDIIKKINAGLNKKEQEKWGEKFEKNAYARKIDEWVGRKKAEKFLLEL